MSAHDQDGGSERSLRHSNGSLVGFLRQVQGYIHRGWMVVPSHDLIFIKERERNASARKQTARPTQSSEAPATNSLPALTRATPSTATPEKARPRRPFESSFANLRPAGTWRVA
eukprot:scaffold4058_cov257-Pinguiococcus_pyrenoidosus.AAC.14